VRLFLRQYGIFSATTFTGVIFSVPGDSVVMPGMTIKTCGFQTYLTDANQRTADSVDYYPAHPIASAFIMVPWPEITVAAIKSNQKKANNEIFLGA
jgi:hypothetical protein